MPIRGRLVARANGQLVFAELSAEQQDGAQRPTQSVLARQAVEHLLVAVVEISGELSGLEFEFIRDFLQTQCATPVPCCLYTS